MKSARGFSLLELLVVLLIVGLFSGLSVAWLNSGRGAAHQALEQLAAQAQIQAARARHSAQVLGLRWTGQAPQFVRWQAERGWVVEPVRLGAWPDSLRADWPASLEPRVLFTPSGIAAPVAVRWHWSEGQERWVWNTDNSLARAVQP